MDFYRLGKQKPLTKDQLKNDFLYFASEIQNAEKEINTNKGTIFRLQTDLTTAQDTLKIEQNNLLGAQNDYAKAQGQLIATQNSLAKEKSERSKQEFYFTSQLQETKEEFAQPKFIAQSEKRRMIFKTYENTGDFLGYIVPTKIGGTKTKKSAPMETIFNDFAIDENTRRVNAAISSGKPYEPYPGNKNVMYGFESKNPNYKGEKFTILKTGSSKSKTDLTQPEIKKVFGELKLSIFNPEHHLEEYGYPGHPYQPK